MASMMVFSNTSSDDISLSNESQIRLPLYYAEVIIMSVVTLLVFVGNTGTIAAFWKVPALREKPSNLLILSLSCADLVCGVNLLMIMPYRITGYWPWGKIGCQINLLIINLFAITGIFTTLAISLDRYLLISRSYPKYMKLQSRKRVKITIFAIWLYSTSFGIAEIILWDIVEVKGVDETYFDYSKVCRSPPKHAFLPAAIYFLLNYFLPVTTIEVLSTGFIIKLRRKLKKTHPVGETSMSQTGSVSLSVQNPNNLTSRSRFGGEHDGSTSTGTSVTNGNRSSSRNRYIKAAVTLAALVVVLNLCLLPYILYTLISNLFCTACSSVTVRVILTHVIRMNSALNPLMYAVTMSKIKQFYKNMFCKRFGV